MERNDIKAETWITVHYPSQKEWIVKHKGIFSRNYSSDLRECNPEELTLELSRDGLYEILPNGMFSTGRELLNLDKEDHKWTDKVLQQRVERIKTAFMPFDSTYFNLSLALESQLNHTLVEKNEVILKDFLGVTIENDQNPYIRLMAPMVSHAAQIRGDYRFLCKLISIVVGFNTTFKRLHNRVRFTVHRPNLHHDSFLKFQKTLEPFFRFVEEWFVPFELQCEFKIRDYTRDNHFEGPNKLMLDYNATLGKTTSKH